MKRLMLNLAAAVVLATTLVGAVSVAVRADQTSIISQPACDAAKKAADDTKKAGGTPLALPAGCNGTTLESTSKKSGYLDVLINAFVFIGAAMSVIYIIIGGIRYMTSTGDSGRIQQAKDTVLYAIIGLSLVLLVRLIIGFLVTNVKV